MLEFTGALALFCLFLWLWIFLPWSMALIRRRRPIFWVLISFVGTPLVAIPLLRMLGRGQG